MNGGFINTAPTGYYGCDEFFSYLSSPIAPIKTISNDVALFFARYLLMDAISVFKWELPKGWNKDYFLYNLYLRGFLCVFNTPEFGVITQACGLEGLDLYYAPKNVIVTNPAFGGKSYRREINKDCVVFKMSATYSGICDLIIHYVTKLALVSQAVDMNLINSKLSYVFGATNKAAAESYKKLFDRIMSGEPAVIADKNILTADGSPNWQTFVNNLKANYITSDLLSDMRKIREMFLTEIGIPNANTDKRERLNTDEVNANNVETRTLAEMWLERFKESCEDVNRMFADSLHGEKMSVDWRCKPNEYNNDDSGAVQL